METEFSQTEEKLTNSNEEKKKIESQNKKLSKLLDKTKQELDQYSIEAEKASKNPWESDEWEGLTAAEMYEMMKHELVPAQQARLSKLCIEELEKQLQESKTSLTNVLIEKENMKADLRKLEAKICFLEKNPSQTEDQVTTVKSNVKATLIAPSKLGASNRGKQSTSIPTPSKKPTSIPTPSKKATARPTGRKVLEETSALKSEERSSEPKAKETLLKSVNEPASSNTLTKSIPTEQIKADKSRRRSTRTASSLANYMIAEALSPDVDNLKKRSASRTDGNASAKKARKTIDDVVTKETEDRDPLGCVTNSPCKKSSSNRSRVPRNGQKRNPEECKQQ